MKRLLMATAVACALSITTLAGDIPSVGAPQPQPQQTTGPTILGGIPTDGGARTISGAAVSAILSALGLAAI